MLINHAGRRRAEQDSTALHKVGQFFCLAGTQHIKCRRDEKPVAIEGRFTADDITTDGTPPERAIMLNAGAGVVLVGVAGVLEEILVPAHFPIINNGNLLRDARAGHGGQRSEIARQPGHLAKDARVAVPDMADQTAMKGLTTAETGAPLEIGHGVGTMGHRLEPGQTVHSRLLKAREAPPVDVARRGFHEQKRLTALEAAVEVVKKGEFAGHESIAFHAVERTELLVAVAASGIAMPVGIGIPADNIADLREAGRIKLLVESHQVGGGRQLAVLAHRRHLGGHEVGGLVADEAFPIEQQPTHGAVDVGDLVETVVGVAPEAAPPSAIHGGHRAVFALQPSVEGCETQRAITGSAVFVADMPKCDRRVAAEPTRQPTVDCRDLSAVDRRSWTMVMAARLMLTMSRRLAATHFRMSKREPVGLGAAGRGQPKRNACGVQPVEDIRHPLQVILAFGRFQTAPGKNAECNGIDARLPHQSAVLIPDPRNIFPLLRIVITAMEQPARFENVIHIFSCRFT